MYILLLLALLVDLLLTLRLILPQVTLELPRSKDVYTYYYVAQGKQARTEARNAPRTGASFYLLCWYKSTNTDAEALCGAECAAHSVH